MSGPYAFAFSDGGKEYTLVCKVESPGVESRFTFALTDGASSWTSNSIVGRPFEPSERWEDEVSAALLGSSGYVFRMIHDTPPRDSLVEKERQCDAWTHELQNAKAQLARCVEDQARQDKELIAPFMELLNSKKEELQRLAEKLKSAQLAPAEEQEARTLQEDAATDDDEGYGSERGSQQRAASSEGGVRSAVTANPESAGGSGVAGATGAAVDANEAHMEAATQDLEERHIMDEDMLDTPPPQRMEEAPARAGNGRLAAPAVPEDAALAAALPAHAPSDRPRALAKRRKRPA